MQRWKAGETAVTAQTTIRHHRQRSADASDQPRNLLQTTHAPTRSVSSRLAQRSSASSAAVRGASAGSVLRAGAGARSSWYSRT
jgi:hypothetical protein